MGSALQQPADNTEELNVINEIEVAMEGVYNQFYNSVIFEMANSKYVPAHKVLSRSMELRSSVTQDSQIVDEATNVANKFVEKSYASAIAGVVSLAMKALLGNTSASVSQKRDYAIAVGGLGGIVRVDYLVYLKSFSFDGILSTTKNIALYAAIISSADTAGLEENDIKALIDVNYGSEFGLLKKQYLYRIIMGEQIDEKEYENLFGKNQSDQRKVQAVPVERTMKSQAPSKLTKSKLKTLLRQDSPPKKEIFKIESINQKFQNSYEIPIQISSMGTIIFEINPKSNQTLFSLVELIKLELLPESENKKDFGFYINAKVDKDVVYYKLHKISEIIAAHQLDQKIMFILNSQVKYQWAENLFKEYQQREKEFYRIWGDWSQDFVFFGWISTLQKTRKYVKIERNGIKVLYFYFKFYLKNNWDQFELIPQISGSQNIQTFRKKFQVKENLLQIEVQKDKVYILSQNNLIKMIGKEQQECDYFIEFEKVISCLHQSSFIIDSIKISKKEDITRVKYHSQDYNKLIRFLLQDQRVQNFEEIADEQFDTQISNESQENLSLKNLTYYQTTFYILGARFTQRIHYPRIVRSEKNKKWKKQLLNEEKILIPQTISKISQELEESKLLDQKLENFSPNKKIQQKVAFVAFTSNLYNPIISLARQMVDRQDLVSIYKKQNQAYEYLMLKNISLHYLDLPLAHVNTTYRVATTFSNKEVFEGAMIKGQKYKITKVPTFVTEDKVVAQKYLEKMIERQKQSRKDLTINAKIQVIQQSSLMRSMHQYSLYPKQKQMLSFRQIMKFKELITIREDKENNIRYQQQIFELIPALTGQRDGIIFFEPFKPASHYVSYFVDKVYEIIHVQKKEHLELLIQIFKNSPFSLKFGINLIGQPKQKQQIKWKTLFDLLLAQRAEKETKVSLYLDQEIFPPKFNGEYLIHKFNIDLYNHFDRQKYQYDSATGQWDIMSL